MAQERLKYWDHCQKTTQTSFFTRKCGPSLNGNWKNKNVHSLINSKLLLFKKNCFHQSSVGPELDWHHARVNCRDLDKISANSLNIDTLHKPYVFVNKIFKTWNAFNDTAVYHRNITQKDLQLKKKKAGIRKFSENQNVSFLNLFGHFFIIYYTFQKKNIYMIIWMVIPRFWWNVSLSCTPTFTLKLVMHTGMF